MSTEVAEPAVVICSRGNPAGPCARSSARGSARSSRRLVVPRGGKGVACSVLRSAPHLVHRIKVVAFTVLTVLAFIVAAPGIASLNQSDPAPVSVSDR